jgi:stage IV sporulation protein FB
MFCYFLLDYNLIFLRTFNIIKNYHYSLLIFNLLPIFPLDGSKLINLTLTKILPYKLAHRITLIISYTILVVTFMFARYVTINLNIYLLLLILLFRLNEEYKNHNSLFNRFLLERHLYNFHFNDLKIINNANLKRMMRDKKHLFNIKGEFITEKTVLKKRFNNPKTSFYIN